MTAQERKERPVYSGVLRYFPLALLEVARCSYLGNEQHNPGEPLRWDRSKSTDEADALVRHLLDAGTVDTDGVRHTAKVAWRALALLQKELEAASIINEPTAPEGMAQVAPGLYVAVDGIDGTAQTVTTTPHDGSHWTVTPADMTTLTYDEKRTSHLVPCRCGHMFTQPQKCAQSGACLAEKHPHFSVTKKSVMTTQDVLDDLQ
jgi:hypothetical protein